MLGVHLGIIIQRSECMPFPSVIKYCETVLYMHGFVCPLFQVGKRLHSFYPACSSILKYCEVVLYTYALSSVSGWKKTTLL